MSVMKQREEQMDALKERDRTGQHSAWWHEQRRQRESSKQSSSPTIYARLMDVRLEHPLAETRYLVEDYLRPSRVLVGALEDQIRKAYAAGVVDGFAQGVAAAESNQDSESA